MARPRLVLTQQIADRICGHIAAGKGLRTIAKLKGMPSRDRIRRWLREAPWFQAQYARAREDCADDFAERIAEFADSTTEENANARRVQIDALKWIASKLRPRVYGDRLAVDVEERPVLRADFSRPQPIDVTPEAVTLEPARSLPGPRDSRKLEPETQPPGTTKGPRHD